MEDKNFCSECQNEKTERFCSKCNKETPNLFKKELIETMKLSDSVKMSVKRGETSWAYFPVAYAIILTLTIGIMSLVDIISWILRIVLIILFAILFFYLCFFNNYFRNKIVGLFTKSKEHEEKFKAQ